MPAAANSSRSSSRSGNSWSVIQDAGHRDPGDADERWRGAPGRKRYVGHRRLVKSALPLRIQAAIIACVVAGSCRRHPWNRADAVANDDRRQPAQARVACAAESAVGAVAARRRCASPRASATPCACASPTRNTPASTSSPTASRRGATSSRRSSRASTASTSSTGRPSGSAIATTPTCRWSSDRSRAAARSSSTTRASCGASPGGRSSTRFPDR